jgi:hypothetical protein
MQSLDDILQVTVPISGSFQALIWFFVFHAVHALTK